MVKEKKCIRGSKGNTWETRFPLSRKYFLFSFLLIIVIVEFLVMQAHSFLHFFLPPRIISLWWVDAFFDSIFVLITLMPFLYFFFLSPLLKNLREYKDLIEATEQSETKYRSLFNLSADAIYVVDKDTLRIVDVNETACSMYGYTHAEWQKLLATDVSAEPHETQKAIKEDIYQIPVRYHKKKDGTIFPLEMSASIFNLQGRQTLLITGRDISERKKEEELLREGSEINEAILMSAMDGFFRTDTHGLLLQVNNAYCNMTGYSKEELLTMHIPELDAVETAEATAAHMQKIIACGEGRFNTKHRRKDGSIFDLEASVQYKDIKEGQFIVFVRDVTERKKNEALLIKAKNDWEETFNALTDVITLHDRDFNILRVNQAAGTFLGKQVQDLVLKKCYQVFHGRQSPVDECPGVMVLQTGKPQVCELFDPELGIYLEVSAYPRFDERKNVVGAVHIVKNISERKDVEKKILTSESKYRTLTAISPIGIFLADMSGVYLYVNIAWCEITGLTISQALGQGWLNTIHSEDRLLVSEDWFACVREKRLFGREFRLQKPDKTVVYVKAQTVLEVNLDGEMSGYIGTLTDVSEFKIIEEQLRHSYDKLKETQEQLVQSTKIATLGQLAGGIAHELNNPLTGVLNNVQLIKMEMEIKKDFNCQDFKELLEIVESSALRCKKIIQSFLDLAHVSKGELQLICLNALIEKVSVIISTEMKLGNISFAKDLQPDLGNIQGDLQLLEEVILVLVSNAKWAVGKRYQNEQGGNIAIKTYQDSEKRDIIMSISDDGIGISQENIAKLFNPFFTTKKVGEGTGLGLSLIQNILQKHNAHIAVESQVNVGTTFKITFPIA